MEAEINDVQIERLARSIVDEMERRGGGQVYKIGAARDAAVKMLAEAEALLKIRTAERDEAKACVREVTTGMRTADKVQRRHFEKVEAQLDKAVTALNEIKRLAGAHHPPGILEQVARRALAEIGEEGQDDE